MNDELFKTLTNLPDPVRLALYAIDGAGRDMRMHGIEPRMAHVGLLDTPPRVEDTDGRDYWLPCSADAIKQHALKLAEGYSVDTVGTLIDVEIRLWDWRDALYVKYESRATLDDNGPDFGVIAAIELLRQVVCP